MKAIVTMPPNRMEATGVFPGFDNRYKATLYIEFYNAATKTPITRLRNLGDLRYTIFSHLSGMTLEDFYYITEVTEG